MLNEIRVIPPHLPIIKINLNNTVSTNFNGNIIAGWFQKGDIYFLSDKKVPNNIIQNFIESIKSYVEEIPGDLNYIYKIDPMKYPNIENKKLNSMNEIKRLQQLAGIIAEIKVINPNFINQDWVKNSIDFLEQEIEYNQEGEYDEDISSDLNNILSNLKTGNYQEPEELFDKIRMFIDEFDPYEAGILNE